jgi:hypothetical protein
MTKALDITSLLHGYYKGEMQSAVQQHWYGNLISRMLGYLFGMSAFRFGKNKDSVALGRRGDGYMQTAAKMYYRLFTTLNDDEKWLGNLAGVNMSGTLTGFIGHALSFMPFVSPWFAIAFCGLNIAKGIPAFIWSNKTKTLMDEAGYTDTQYRNIRRAGLTYLWISAMTIIKVIFSREFNDDDDDPR